MLASTSGSGRTSARCTARPRSSTRCRPSRCAQPTTGSRPGTAVVRVDRRHAGRDRLPARRRALVRRRRRRARGRRTRASGGASSSPAMTAIVDYERDARRPAHRRPRGASAASRSTASPTGPVRRARPDRVGLDRRRRTRERRPRRSGATGIYVWDGDFYATGLIERLGKAEAGGVLRIGLVHYNTAAEVDRTLEALERISNTFFFCSSFNRYRIATRGGADRRRRRRGPGPRTARRRTRARRPPASPDQKPRPPLLGPKRASRLSGASSRSPSRGTATASPNSASATIARSRSQRVAEPDAVDHLRQPDDRDRERDRQPEHDARAAAGARRSRPRSAARAAPGSTQGLERGAGAGDQREEDEEDHGVRFNAAAPRSDEQVLNLGACLLRWKSGPTWSVRGATSASGASRRRWRRSSTATR